VNDKLGPANASESSEKTTGMKPLGRGRPMASNCRSKTASRRWDRACQTKVAYSRRSKATAGELTESLRGCSSIFNSATAVSGGVVCGNVVCATPSQIKNPSRVAAGSAEVMM